MKSRLLAMMHIVATGVPYDSRVHYIAAYSVFSSCPRSASLFTFAEPREIYSVTFPEASAGVCGDLAGVGVGRSDGGSGRGARGKISVDACSRKLVRRNVFREARGGGEAYTVLY